MIHIETPGIMRVAVSQEMLNRIQKIKIFLLHAKRRPTNEMLAAYGVASLGDFVSAETFGHIFCSFRGGVPTPFSFLRIREDMRAVKVTHYDFPEPSPELKKTIKEIRKKMRGKKDEEIILLGIGFSCDLIERLVEGESIKVGPPHAAMGEMTDYESDMIRDYRPVLIN